MATDEQHLTDDDLGQLFARTLPPSRARTVGAHVRQCDACASRVDRSAQLGASADAIAATAFGDDVHLDFDRELLPYVDGVLDRHARERVDAHVTRCARCARELADLQTFASAKAQQPRRRRIGAMPLAAAAAIALIIAAALLFRPAAHPSPSAPTQIALRDGMIVMREGQLDYGRADWNALAARALQTLHVDGSLPRRLRTESDPLRGGSAAAASKLVPSGVVIDDTQPRFQWPATPTATYELVVHHLGDGEVASSGRIETHEWRSARELPRGATYVWQVTVYAPDREPVVLPSPSDPEARFAIVDAAVSRDIRDASDRGNHLVAALLSARAGDFAKARREIAHFVAENPHSKEAATLQARINALGATASR